MPIGEVCNREVVIARRDETVLDAARLMRRYHVGDLIVVDERPEGRVPIGIVTDRDIAIAVVALERDPATCPIGDVMTRDPLVAREDEGVARVIECMRVKGVRRLPVVDARGTLVGLLTLDDVLELLADELSALPRLVSREQERERVTRPA